MNKIDVPLAILGIPLTTVRMAPLAAQLASKITR